MKLTVVTAVFNAIKSGNRERLIRCVRSVAALKTEHEHLIYDGGSTDGTVELLRELEREVNGEKKSEKCEVRSEKLGIAEGSLCVGGRCRCTADVDAGPCPRRDSDVANLVGRGQGLASTRDESGALGDRALPGNESSAIHHSSFIVHHSPTLRVVSEPDTGIYNALNKGVRDAQGEWFYVLGCDDCISHPEVMDRILAEENPRTEVIVTPVSEEAQDGRIVSHKFTELKAFGHIFRGCVCCHQGEIMKTKLARELGGFDEQYRISADTNMFLLAHLRAAKFHYIFEEFATFHLGGTADSNVAPYKREDQLSVERALKLSPKGAAFYEQTEILPVGRSLRLMMHRDLGVRIGAYYMFRSWVKMYLVKLGIIN